MSLIMDNTFSLQRLKAAHTQLGPKSRTDIIRYILLSPFLQIILTKYLIDTNVDILFLCVGPF